MQWGWVQSEAPSDFAVCQLSPPRLQNPLLCVRPLGLKRNVCHLELFRGSPNLRGSPSLWFQVFFSHKCSQDLRPSAIFGMLRFRKSWELTNGMRYGRQIIWFYTISIFQNRNEKQEGKDLIYYLQRCKDSNVIQIWAGNVNWICNSICRRSIQQSVSSLGS